MATCRYKDGCLSLKETSQNPLEWFCSWQASVSMPSKSLNKDSRQRLCIFLAQKKSNFFYQKIIRFNCSVINFFFTYTSTFLEKFVGSFWTSSSRDLWSNPNMCAGIKRKESMFANLEWWDQSSISQTLAPERLSAHH